MARYNCEVVGLLSEDGLHLGIWWFEAQLLLKAAQGLINLIMSDTVMLDYPRRRNGGWRSFDQHTRRHHHASYTRERNCGAFTQYGAKITTHKSASKTQ